VRSSAEIDGRGSVLIGLFSSTVGVVFWWWSERRYRRKIRGAAEPLRAYVLDLLSAALAEASRAKRLDLVVALGLAISSARAGEIDEHFGAVPVLVLAAARPEDVLRDVAAWLASMPARWPEDVRRALDEAAPR